MTNRLKLVELLEEDGGTFLEIIDADNFKDVVSNPEIEHLVPNYSKAEDYNTKKGRISIKNLANQLSRDLHVYELDPSNKSKYKDFSLGQLQNTLQELEEKENIFNRKKIRKEYLEISDLIDNYINLQKNINRSKVASRCPKEAMKITQEARRTFKTKYGKLDILEANTDLRMAYFSSGNPHAINAVLVGNNDWKLVNPN